MMGVVKDETILKPSERPIEACHRKLISAIAVVGSCQLSEAAQHTETHEIVYSAQV